MMAKWIGRMFGKGKENRDANSHANGDATPDARAITLPGRVTPIGTGESLSPLVDPDDVLTFEFGRSRRYERALSIVVVAPISWPDEHGTEALPVLSLLTAAGLREILRETDIMCYQPAEGGFVLGLTESEGPAARLALERVQTLFKSRLRIDLAIGVAQFPSDGLTLEDLVAVARVQAGLTKVIEVVPIEAPAVNAPLTRRVHHARGNLARLPSPRAVGSE